MNKTKCVVTDQPALDTECEITIMFGYGSSRDLTKYTFSPVSHDAGVRILQFIQRISSKDTDQFKEEIDI